MSSASSWKPSQPADRWLKQSVLGVYASALLFFSVWNAVFFKRMTNTMPNYPYFLSQVTSWIYLPVLGLVLLFKRVFDRPSPLEDEELPQLKLAFVGLLEAIAGICTVLGGVYTRGTTQMILVQASIPMTMFWSACILGTRYVVHQFVAAGVIIGGALVVLTPRLIGIHSSGSTSTGTVDLLFFNLVFLAAQLPQSLAHVYKEYALRGQEMSVFIVMFYIAWYQSLIGLSLIPVNSLRLFGPARVPLHDLPSLLLNGIKCLLGQDVLRTDCIIERGDDGTSLPPCDHCRGAWLPVLLYMIANILYNVFGILVIKHGGATLYTMLMTLRLPLVSFAFCMSFFMGDEAQPVDWYDLVGLVVILIGLCIYRWEERAAHRTENEAPTEASQALERDHEASANVAVGPILSEPLLLDTPAGAISPVRQAAAGTRWRPLQRAPFWSSNRNANRDYDTFG